MLSGHAIECRINAENPFTFRTFARHDHPVPRAGRIGRALRFRALLRLPNPALLRQPRGQADRAWAQSQRMPDAAAPGAGRTRRRRHRDHHSSVSDSWCASQTSSMANTTSIGSNISSPSRASDCQLPRDSLTFEDDRSFKHPRIEGAGLQPANLARSAGVIRYTVCDRSLKVRRLRAA